MKEKSIVNLWIRRALRILAYLTLLTEFIFSVLIPKINQKPVYLDVNDGYLIGFSVALLLSIEAIKTAVDKYAEKKLNN